METNIHFLSYLAEFFLEWEIFATNVVEKIETSILSPVTFEIKNHAIYETAWKSMVEPYRTQVTKCRMRIACWIPKAKNTHSE